MGKFNYAKLSIGERDKVIDPLVEALSRLRKKDQMKEFLSRLLTPSEIVMLGRRLQVAERLVEGKSYQTIREEVGVGFSTIQSVDSWLEDAVRDYHQIRHEQLEDMRRKEVREKKSSAKYRSARIHPTFRFLDMLIHSIGVAGLEENVRRSEVGKKS